MTNKFNHAYYITGPIEQIHTETQAKNKAGVLLWKNEKKRVPQLETCVTVDKEKGKVTANEVGLIMIRRYLANNPTAVCMPWDEYAKEQKKAKST